MPWPFHARRSSPGPGRSTLTTSAPRSAMSVEQYGPAITRERSRTRTPASMPSAPGSATVEEPLGHRVHLGGAGPRDRVDPRLHLGERADGLRGEHRGELGDALAELRARDDRVDEAERQRLGGRVAPAGHDDLLGARGADEPDEARRRPDAERHAEVDLGNPELRLGRGDPEIARESQAPPAPDGVAVDRGDRRLLEPLKEHVRALEESAELALAL